MQSLFFFHNRLIFLQVKLEVGEEVLVLDTTDQDKWQVRIINLKEKGRFFLNNPNCWLNHTKNVIFFVWSLIFA